MVTMCRQCFEVEGIDFGVGARVAFLPSYCTLLAKDIDSSVYDKTHLLVGG